MYTSKLLISFDDDGDLEGKMKTHAKNETLVILSLLKMENVKSIQIDGMVIIRKTSNPLLVEITAGLNQRRMLRSNLEAFLESFH